MADRTENVGSFLDFSGKTALVAGVLDENSIGWPIAKMLNDGGARIALSIQRKAVRRMMGDIPDQLNNPLITECDVSKDEQVERLFSQVEQEFGHLDYLIHSIAYAPPTSFGQRFINIARADFALAMDVSAYSLIPVVRYAAPLMPEGGAIITLTFQASDRVFPGYNVMGTAKAALENEVRQLAYELGPRGIRVNALSPGPLDTLSSRAIHGYVDMKRVQAERSPLQRNITHDEVGKAALFLLSDLSSGITGHILPIDGGYQIAGV